MTKGQRILYVEDSDTDIEFLRMRLEDYAPDLDIIVDTAQTVEEAKLVFNHKVHQLVVLDWNLPDGNGFDVASYIRNISNQVSLIFASGALSDTMRKHANSFAPKALLEKKYDKAEIAQITNCL